MKTKAKSIRVAVKLCGFPVVRLYPIKAKNGQLMTNRLEQIIKGNLGRSYERGHDHPDIEMIGVVWERPYEILSELMKDRVAMQAKLLAMDGHSALTDEDATIIPDEAPDCYISQMVLHEIRLRKALKRELHLLATR